MEFLKKKVYNQNNYLNFKIYKYNDIKKDNYALN